MKRVKALSSVAVCSVLFIINALLVGCSSKPDEPEGVIPAAQLKALEKAKEVEDVLKKQEEALRKKVDEAK